MKKTCDETADFLEGLSLQEALDREGVRQVGKTWLLKEFGRMHYENTAYFNFDENPEYRDFFRTTKDVQRILPNLAMASGQDIQKGKTLLIFDEVQDSPEVLNALKYFAENAPEYHVACAGSLLGITLARPSSFPVGKVDFLSLYPMSFTEFLMATGSENLAAYLGAVNEIEPLPDAFFNPLAEKLKMYYVTGGMPEVVSRWEETQSVGQVQQVLMDIIQAYERDFMKHPAPREYPKIGRVWNSLPCSLRGRIRNFSTMSSKRGQGRGSMRMRSSGWCMRRWSTRSSASRRQASAFRL